MQVRNPLAHTLSLATIFSLLFAAFAVFQTPRAQAQTRVNDRDMQALIKNLRDDAKSFRPHFDSAVHKSTIRKTSQEKHARELAASFERQTNTLLKHFKRDKNGQAAFDNVMSNAEDIDRIINSLALGPAVTSQWDRIRTEIHQLAVAYGVPDRLESENQNRGDEHAGLMEDRPGSCMQSAGREKASRLVNECLQVSPATHPPCNVQNSCAQIIGEIKRSCALIGTSAPSFCGNY